MLFLYGEIFEYLIDCEVDLILITDLRILKFSTEVKGDSYGLRDEML